MRVKSGDNPILNLDSVGTLNPHHLKCRRFPGGHLRIAKGTGNRGTKPVYPKPRWLRAEHRYRAAPIRKTLVPQEGQVPDVAGLPFFMVMAWGSLISFLDLHFTQ